ncbi:MAG: hypothetical protein M3R02_13505, partial [Chloroflexota bacterium]|nr:hypothetical protein [Chloroflexota bacterium]
LTHLSYQSTRYVSIRLKGAVRAAFVNELQDGDQFTLEPLLDEDQNLIGFRLDTSLSPPVLTPATAMGTPLLFTSVRPEWRDSQSLLGYYNPLTGDYEWTPFLRFLLRAKRSFETQDGLAWFVILDEMNLARVEYYFADLLSVLESGRDAEGWTREPLRLGYPEEAEGDLPPRELRLPPNLYLIGTVNMDETTPAFSPKVLDRAFTLELSEVDFTDYPVAPSAGDNRVLNDKDRHQLLADFSGGGRFARIDKAVISHYAAVHPEIGKRLQTLNSLLRPFNLHFGYRVFDEIVAFLDAAARNKLFTDLGGSSAAFDAAVLMKILPKFHGSRGKLERPLHAVLAWCVNPDAPNHTAVVQAVHWVEDPDALLSALEPLVSNAQCPRTADRVGRMLWSLHTDGFAAFG